MNFTGTVSDIALDVKTGKPRITFLADTKEALQQYEEIKDIDKLSVEVKKYRDKRSLDANAYLWVLLQKMAEVLKTTKEELYILSLERYGVFTHIVVKPQVVEKTKEVWRYVKELGEVKINGKTGVQIQCYFGSSTYDTKEMATLIDGVVSECKELGIETLPAEEIESMKKEWGA